MIAANNNEDGAVETSLNNVNLTTCRLQYSVQTYSTQSENSTVDKLRVFNKELEVGRVT